ncbi:hypothetical protein QBE52_14475 [Clostridiaceae bacterium 35-E11]
MYNKKEKREKTHLFLKGSHNNIKNVINMPHEIKAIEKEVVSNIPIVLAQFTIKLDVHEKILLPKQTNSIESIKNKVRIMGCRMIPNFDQIFIEGIINKNIYFVENISRKLRYYKIDIPFEHQFWVSIQKLRLASMNLKNLDQILTCDVINSKIIESCQYIYDNPKTRGVEEMEGYHSKIITEIDTTMILYLLVQILEYRNILIPFCNHEKNDEKKEENDPIQEQYEEIVKNDHDEEEITEDKEERKKHNETCERKNIEVTEVQRKNNQEVHEKNDIDILYETKDIHEENKEILEQPIEEIKLVKENRNSDEEEMNSMNKFYWQIRCYPCCAKHYPHYFERKCKKYDL